MDIRRKENQLIIIFVRKLNKISNQMRILHKQNGKSIRKPEEIRTEVRVFFQLIPGRAVQGFNLTKKISKKISPCIHSLN